MIKDGEKIIVICRDRKCIYNDYSTDTCDIDSIITIVKGKCADKIESKKGGVNEADANINAIR